MTQVPPPGSQPLPTTRVDFEVEAAAGYVRLKLSDGAVLNVHPIIGDVLKTALVDDRGEPVYIVAGGFAVRLMTKPTGAEGE